VDRTVARIGSAAVAKAVRRQPGKRFVAVSCHADIEEWLCPDWVIEMLAGTLARRSLRRPAIELEIARVHPSAWQLFKHHHYLDDTLHKGARCFVAFWQGRPVAFASALHSPRKVSFWREHRTVCLPDFQGVGIGNALSEFVAGAMKGTGKRYMSVTGYPAMIRHRSRSPHWRMHRKPSRTGRDSMACLAARRTVDRLTSGFEYVGAARGQESHLFFVSVAMKR
jgi:GNAT superfamily N-acetyltransferase